MSESKQLIYPLSQPLPYSLKQVTCYVVKGDSKLTIIDTGLHTKQTSDTWKQFFFEQGWSWNQVERIVVTHYHPDHYGFAGKLQEWSGAPIYMAKTEFDQIQSFWNRNNGNPKQVSSFFIPYGFPEHRSSQITRHMEEFRAVIEPHPQVIKWIESGEELDISGEKYEVIATPGHSKGHLSFFHHDGSFFAGDVILPSVTPNIPLLPDGDPNPLQTFLDTLDKLKQLDIKVVYPAHGEAFHLLEKRVEEIKAHHERRLDKLKSFLLDGKIQTGFEICEKLFAHRPLDIHNLRFAFSETLAHLEFLRINGEIKQTKVDNVYHYYK
ncbi:MBL fold metallo-hydrolase [Shimazuella kribbensis]|uniref:MBL fold metallo-hydrolase n=1 Tax=Shimazuella kribbensis TaxID=139808 RepID=UPI001471A90F|nr:MBL fold metallo-hydrolase [Shimazuella kribbensis]